MYHAIDYLSTFAPVNGRLDVVVVVARWQEIRLRSVGLGCDGLRQIKHGVWKV